jgi:imidazole glycerol-phosphate synthase subunit HisF
VLKIRVIPVLFLMNGLIVRSEGFAKFQIIGNPIDELERYSHWLADELVYVDITREGGHDIRREDHRVKSAGDDILAILRQIARSCFMPLTFGGRINSLEQVDAFIRNGADKVLINTAAHRNPALVTEVAETHGSQAMVAGIDVKRIDGAPVVHIDQGRTAVADGLADYARRLESLGAGEILVNSIDRDGAAEGYDLAALRIVAEAVSIPVVACGGVGGFGDFCEAVDEAGASAVAAGNVFHFTEHSYKRAKRTMRNRGLAVRYPYPS